MAKPIQIATTYANETSGEVGATRTLVLLDDGRIFQQWVVDGALKPGLWTEIEGPWIK